jgi:hypothetical protein
VFGDERIGIEDVQPGEHRERLHQRAEREALPLAAENGPGEPREDADQRIMNAVA